MSADPCGCVSDGLTGLPITPCGEHGGKPATPSDRLLEAALPAADRLMATHTISHIGDFKTCRLAGCIEARTLLAAIRECWPTEQPKQTEEGEQP